MRRIRFQPPTNEKKLQRWLQDCQKANGEVQKSIDRGEKPEFNQNLYKRRKAELFGDESSFHGKCAYCECYISGFQHGDVEHFRPKAGVTDESDRAIEHPGYYWLAYDLQNLLPACAICNQPSTVNNRKIGKHNRFPVIGEHAQTAAEIVNEQPLLINPASDNDRDDPSRHLKIDISTGLMIPLTERGRMCIEIFGLNVRDRLLEERRTAISEVQSLLTKLIYKVDFPQTGSKIKAIRQGKYSYSMAQNEFISDYERKLNS